jgi:hypothetical protein
MVVDGHVDIISRRDVDSDTISYTISMPKSQPTGSQNKSKPSLSRANIVRLDSAVPSPRTRRFDPLTAVCYL